MTPCVVGLLGACSEGRLGCGTPIHMYRALPASPGARSLTQQKQMGSVF